MAYIFQFVFNYLVKCAALQKFYFTSLHRNLAQTSMYKNFPGNDMQKSFDRYVSVSSSLIYHFFMLYMYFQGKFVREKKHTQNFHTTIPRCFLSSTNWYGKVGNFFVTYTQKKTDPHVWLHGKYIVTHTAFAHNPMIT